MTHALVLDPAFAPWVIWGLGALALLALGLAIARGLAGWPLRAIGLLVLLAGLLGPMLQTKEARPLNDILLAVVDDSSSQSLGERSRQTSTALAALQAAVAALPGTELRISRFADGADDSGSLAMAALSKAIAAEPRSRIAGVVLISDGQIHDAGLAPSLPAPLQVLLTGQPQDWDRRLIITGAPAFAIIGQEFPLTLRIEDEGAAPPGALADLTITVDDQAPQSYQIPVGQDFDLPVQLQHGGMNVLHFATSEAKGELTTANNAALVQINGIRDRLRVLLVSGEPHAGERVWRNLLKSDPSVDLVHFTILRPPEKQDGIPVEELALIAFPTRELFVEKIREFDLIIFDRYRMRDILPMEYIQNVVDYVRGGGTVLVAAGPEFGAVDSLWRTPLADILPGEPTSRVVEGAFRPALTDLGQRHPVTSGLDKLAPATGWGHWFRLMEVIPLSGEVLMEGPQKLPLLILSRVDEGRMALLTSDQSWLWGRGYDGGGPQLELLKRLAHWMLKEPDLEEEALVAEVRGQTLSISRRSIRPEPPGTLIITAPDGSETRAQMRQDRPGLFRLDWLAPQQGLYRLEQDDLTRVIGVGPAAPREFARTLASDEALGPIAKASLGGVTRLSDGFPALRRVSPDRPAIGRGWIGLTPRQAEEVTGLTRAPLLPPAVLLAMAALASIGAWAIEGRRRRPGTA